MHPLAGVVETVCGVEQTDGPLDLSCVIRALLKDVDERSGVFGVLEVVDDHEGDLTLVDILTVVPLRLLELLPLQVQQVVLDLERHPHVLHELY